MVKFTLNGREVEVDDNTTILTAARDQAIDVPTFCYQDRLTTLASCRMCLVEVEGHRKLEPACSTSIAEGMVVNTHSEKVVNTREDMLEILLANHPLDCPICDKGGECELQDTVFEYGKGDSRLHDPKRVFRSKDIELNDVIIFNAQRCIQCQRCVRVCEEIVGEVALGTAERGLDSEITGVGDSLKDCSHCGNCIEVCPVGALMSTPYRYTARPWDLKRNDTVCNMCGTGCNMTIETREGELMRVKSKFETGLNGELLCAKGRFGFDAIDGGDRITGPMIRKGGFLLPATWDEASRFIADKIQETQDKGGTIGGCISPRQTNETAYLFQKFMRTQLKSNLIVSSTRFAGLSEGNPSTSKALAQIVGVRYNRQPLEEALKADCILLLGTNTMDENPVSGYLIRQTMRDRHNKLFVASSRPNGLDDVASATLRLRPGMEAYLLSALTAKAKVKEDDLAAFVASAKSTIGNSDSVILLLGTEFLRTAEAGNCLNWILDTVTKLEGQGKKVSIQFLFDRPNQLGVWDMGCLPSLNAGWQGGVELTKNTNQPLDFIYSLGMEASALSLKEDGCLVVQGSHMNEMASRQATVILPAPCYGEENGTFTNNEGRVQPVRIVKQPLEGVLATPDVFGLIALAMDSVFGPVRVDQIYNEIRKEVPSYSGLCDWSDDLDFGFTTASASAPSFGDKTDVKLETPVKPKARKGHSLITGDDLFQSGLVASRSDILSTMAEEAYVEMNPGNEVNGSTNGHKVTIKRDGEEFVAPLKINKGFPEGLVFVPEKWLGDDNKISSDNTYPANVEVTITQN